MDVSEKIVRNSLRLIDYEYSQPGAYFVTICTGNRACFFGNIVDGIMISFSICEIVREIWLEIQEKFQDIKLDAFVIMPNHVHGIVIIDKEDKGLIHQPLTDIRSDFGIYNDEKSWILMENSKKTTGRIIRYFKARSTKLVHDSGFLNFKWQRNYIERFVRSRRELNTIREYMINNPFKWSLDRENRISKKFNMNFDKYFKNIF